MSYRPVAIHVTGGGLLGYSARVTLEDDGLPEKECPVHGWDGPQRDKLGTMVQVPGENLSGCACSVACGFDIECGTYDGMTHKRAWRKALRENGGTLYPRIRGGD